MSRSDVSATRCRGVSAPAGGCSAGWPGSSTYCSRIWFIASSDGEPCGYVSVERQGEDLFHLQKIYVLPRFQGLGAGEFLFRRAVEYIRSVHPGPCMMELNVNRRNRALHFYERMGMRRLREGDFPIGDGYYMNDYIMGLEIV